MSEFSAGDRVRTRMQRPHGHTRLPHYLQARIGTVMLDLGAFPLADDRAAALPAHESHLYTVQFDALEVWPEAEWRGEICADLFEEYLEPVS